MNLDLTSFAIFSRSLFQPRYRSATSFISLLSVFLSSFSKNAFRNVDAVAVFLSIMFPLNSGPSCLFFFFSFFFFVPPFLAFARGSEVLFVLLLLEFIPRACCSTGHIPPFCRYRSHSRHRSVSA